MDRRSFLGLLAGSFALKLLPMGDGVKAVFHKLPPFDPAKIKWLPFIPFADQAAIVSKGIINASHTCRCGKELHGLWAAATVQEDYCKTPADFHRHKEAAKARAIDLMRRIWEEVRETGLVRHAGCPLQPEPVIV